jgi:uncharacterized protein (DUF924 family)
MTTLSSNDILHFWFKELSPPQWFEKNKTIDQTISTQFKTVHQMACRGELFQWRQTAHGCLAEIILLDQFSRNIYRDHAYAFSNDTMALTLAQYAIHQKLDKKLSDIERGFLYLPYMHSESSLIHTEAVKLYQTLDNKTNLEYEIKHKVIIDRFGRYPHRNEILGRQSTHEERDFLEGPGSSF